MSASISRNTGKIPPGLFAQVYSFFLSVKHYNYKFCSAVVQSFALSHATTLTLVTLNNLQLADDATILFVAIIIKMDRLTDHSTPMVSSSLDCIQKCKACKVSVWQHRHWIHCWSFLTNGSKLQKPPPRASTCRAIYNSFFWHYYSHRLLNHATAWRMSISSWPQSEIPH